MVGMGKEHVVGKLSRYFVSRLESRNGRKLAKNKKGEEEGATESRDGPNSTETKKREAEGAIKTDRIPKKGAHDHGTRNLSIAAAESGAASNHSNPFIQITNANVIPSVSKEASGTTKTGS